MLSIRVLAVLTAVSLVAISLLNRTSSRADTTEATAVGNNVRTAVFAGGCFWCMEPPFEKLKGVSAVESGYTGGFKVNPTYKEVCSGTTGHVEAIRVSYDPEVIAYEDLLQVFWRNINPTDDEGQFVDRGSSYLSAIFVANDEERAIAEKSKADLAASGRFTKPIVTPVLEASRFYLAEAYHQDYYKKSYLKYKYYRYRSGRDKFINRAWGDDKEYVPVARNESAQETPKYTKPSEEELKERLTRMQFKVTQREATEPAFRNKYWDNKKAGIYVDVVSGEPLFSSTDKFKSGTGWPSFTQPVVKEHVVEKVDFHLGYPRKEVRSKYGDSHLGHVFGDGPRPTGLRYCINSAALRFVPVSKLEEEGLGEFLRLFQ